MSKDTIRSLRKKLKESEDRFDEFLYELSEIWSKADDDIEGIRARDLFSEATTYYGKNWRKYHFLLGQAVAVSLRSTKASHWVLAVRELLDKYGSKL